MDIIERALRPFFWQLWKYVEVPVHFTRFHHEFHVRRFSAITAGTVPQE